MKRFIAVLSGLLVLPAFAEVVPVYYDEIVEYTDDMLDEFNISDEELAEEKNTQQQQPKIMQRNVAGRTVSRTIPAGNTTSNSRANTSSRVVASSPRNAQQSSRSIVSRTAKTQGATTKTAVVSRSRASANTRNATVSSRNTTTNKPVTARVSATGNIMSGLRDGTSSNSLTSSNILADSGEPLYISNVANTAGKNTRRTTQRTSGVSGKITKVNIADATATTTNLGAVSDLTEYCKTQYAQCMDNYCNVLDDNQARCSCSENIKSYEIAQSTLATITEDFQDAIQQIKYIGLTPKQIESLFTETEAEETLKNVSDDSDIKRSLDAIKNSIMNTSVGTTSDTENDFGVSTDASGLINTSIDSASASLSVPAMTLNIGGNTATKISRQKGKELFDTATDRCSTSVLNACIEQGIDEEIILNSYDLAIDKDCIEYERALKNKTTEMRNNVRNAQNILKQARLLVAQQKNAYDLRGCVAALDECMQNEYVCGEDYAFCLDPTGKYVANGEIVKGSKPGMAGVMSVSTTSADGLSSVWAYDGSASDWQLTEFIDKKIKKWKTIYNKQNTSSAQSDVALQLLARIGYINTKNGKQYGMCSNILNQCQDYTFETKNDTLKYQPDNDVIRQYLSLALLKIKAKQDALLAEYAENCWTDVYSCLAINNYDEEKTSAYSGNRVAVNSCQNEINTCMSVSGDTGDLYTWVASHISGNTNQTITPIQIGYHFFDPEALATSGNLVALQFDNGCKWAIMYIVNDTSGTINTSSQSNVVQHLTNLMNIYPGKDAQCVGMGNESTISYNRPSVKLIKDSDGNCVCPTNRTINNYKYTFQTKTDADVNCLASSDDSFNTDGTWCFVQKIEDK